jgi:hypothetical protein
MPRPWRRQAWQDASRSALAAAREALGGAKEALTQSTGKQ